MATFLADTSAWAWAQRKRAPEDLQREWSELVIDGAVATCGIVKFELLHSTNNADEFAALRANLDALDQVDVVAADHERAIDVALGLAWARGGNVHRAIRIQDSLIAAAAERTGLTVLHYDSDFDDITSVTGQPTRWIRPRGSL